MRFFGGVTARYAFEVRRADVFRIWPALPEPASSLPALKKVRPIQDGIFKAIADLWPNGLPRELRAKERNARIRKYLDDHRLNLPNSDAALARAVQRVMKSRA